MSCHSHPPLPCLQCRVIVIPKSCFFNVMSCHCHSRTLSSVYIIIMSCNVMSFSPLSSSDVIVLSLSFPLPYLRCYVLVISPPPCFHFHVIVLSLSIPPPCPLCRLRPWGRPLRPRPNRAFRRTQSRFCGRESLSSCQRTWSRESHPGRKEGKIVKSGKNGEKTRESLIWVGYHSLGHLFLYHREDKISKIIWPLERPWNYLQSGTF